MLHDLVHIMCNKCNLILLSVLVIIGGYCVTCFWKSYSRRILFQRIRKNKQKRNNSSKEKFGKELKITDNQNDLIQKINSMSMEEIIEFLKRDKNNYEAIFNVFQVKAFQEDRKLNCVLEFLKLDVSEVDLNGPFAGIPVSIKDNVIIKGFESYVGCASFLTEPIPKNHCVMVKVLLKLGAIPFLRTTVSQTTMSLLSSNPIDGQTKNPQNVNFIPGGSSSGEGALVGAKASLFGFGSDIGGSVRLPAAFCGVVGFKPTVDRMSMHGELDLKLQTHVRSTFGPICRDVNTCSFVMKTIFDSGLISKYDPVVPPVPFNNDEFHKTKLKIAYFTHDESFPVLPAMRRAVEESAVKLRNKGHEVVEWKPPRSGKDWWSMYLRGISLDGCHQVARILKDDVIDDAMKNRWIHVDFTIWDKIINYFKYKLPDFIINPDERCVYQYCTESLSASERYVLMAEIESFKREVIDEWTRNGFDALLCPAGGVTALPIKSTCYFCPLLSYIFLWNLLNFPAGTVPVTKVQQQDLDEMMSNPVYKSTKTLEGVCKDQMGTLNLSVSAQCVSLPWKEELCLNLMKQLE